MVSSRQTVAAKESGDAWSRGSCRCQLGGGAHHPRLPVLEHHHVLNPSAAPAADVYPRLDGGDHAILQLVLRLPGEPGRFVDQQSDAVAEAVAEVLAVAGLSDDVV